MLVTMLPPPQALIRRIRGDWSWICRGKVEHIGTFSGFCVACMMARGKRKFFCTPYARASKLSDWGLGRNWRGTFGKYTTLSGTTWNSRNHPETPRPAWDHEDKNGLKLLKVGKWYFVFLTAMPTNETLPLNNDFLKHLKHYTVNLEVLPQHQNRCKFLQLCEHQKRVKLHQNQC